MDEAQAGEGRRVGVAEVELRPRHLDGALVGQVVAGEGLDQRRLARAVLADECVHLAGADDDVDAVERALAGEGLREPVDRERRDVARRGGVGRLHGRRL
jgi:hypothetical protein